MTDILVTDILIACLIVLPAFDWLAAFILLHVSHRYPDVLTLRERAVAAFMLATVGSIAGILALVRFGVFEVTNTAMLTLLAIALVLASLPNLFWVLLLVTGRFRLPDDPR